MGELDLTHLKQAVVDIKAHQHPNGYDIYCHNLQSWLGERAHLLIAELEQLRADHNQALRLLTDIVTESDPYDHGEQPVGWICSIRPMVDAKSWLTERGLLAEGGG